MDRSRGFGRKTPQHQGRATVATPQNAEAGAGTVQGGKSGRIDEIWIGSELAEQRTDTGERSIARPVLTYCAEQLTLSCLAIEQPEAFCGIGSYRNFRAPPLA